MLHPALALGPGPFLPTPCSAASRLADHHEPEPQRIPHSIAAGEGRQPGGELGRAWEASVCQSVLCSMICASWYSM